LGEGSHNNHHRYPASASFAFERFDAGYWSLLALRKLGLVWDLKVISPHSPIAELIPNS